jgi:phosphate transport system permease protein
VIGTMAFALPLGVGSAIYLTEYAKQGFLTRLIRLAILNLAGVPSVVYGLFGLGLFVFFLGFGSSILAGALTLACLVLPIVITASEEALKSVDVSYRQASLALGATRWQTIRHVVLPHAAPGIITGMILAIGRAAGETAPILLTVAAFFLPRMPQSVFDQVMALPYHLYIISTQVPGMPESIKYGTALVLLGIVSIFFAIATAIRIRFRMINR